jgi:hypothetical protein
MAIEITSFRADTWERVFGAMELVRQRLARAASALESAGIPYAVAGGHAVAAWVAQVDPGAVRNTPDVDILINRSDFDRVKTCLEAVGFVHAHVWGIDCFLDGPDGSVRSAVHILYAGERVYPQDAVPTPEVAQTQRIENKQILELEKLVRMKLVANRRKDQAHLIDMIQLGLIDANWLDRLPPQLAERLKQLLDNPE